MHNKYTKSCTIVLILHHLEYESIKIRLSRCHERKVIKVKVSKEELLHIANLSDLKIKYDEI